MTLADNVNFEHVVDVGLVGNLTRGTACRMAANVDDSSKF